MGDKKLTLQVDAKVSPAVQNLNKLLDDFASRGNKVAKAFQGVAGVGPEGQKDVKQGGLAKALLQEKKLFDDLGKSGEKLAKVLNEQVTKSQTSLAKQLDTSTRNLEQLVRKHENAQARVKRLQQQGAAPEMVKMFQTTADDLGGQVLAAAAQQSQARAALEAFKTPAAMTSLKGIAAAVAGPLVTTLVVGAAMQSVGKSVLAYYNAPYAARAATGNALSGGVAAGLQGDIASAVALQDAINDPDRKTRMEWTAGTAGVGNVMSVLKSVIPNFMGGVPFSEGMSAIMGFRERQVSAMVQADIERQQQLMQADPETVARVQYLQANAGSNVAMMRETGMDPRVLQAYRERGARGAQLDIGQYDALHRSLAGMVGTHGAANILGFEGGDSLYAALRGGISTPAAAAMAAAGQMAGTNLLDLGTDYDRTLQNMVGSHVAGAIMDPSRLLSMGGGSGYMAQMYAGVGGGVSPAQQMRIVQQNMMGDQAFSNLAGASPFQQAANLANAVGILGRRGEHSVLAQSKLSEVFKDPALLANVMAGGAMPGQWTGVGLRREDIKEFSRETLSQAAMSTRRFGGNIPAARAIEKLLRGGTVTEEEAQMAGGALAEARPDLFNDVTGTAFARRSGGLRRGERAAAGSGAGRVDAAAGSVELKALDVSVRNIVAGLGKLGGATDKVADQINRAAAAIARSTSWLQNARGDARDFVPVLFHAQANPNVYDTPSR